MMLGRPVLAVINCVQNAGWCTETTKEVKPKPFRRRPPAENGNDGGGLQSAGIPDHETLPHPPHNLTTAIPVLTTEPLRLKLA